MKWPTAGLILLLAATGSGHDPRHAPLYPDHRMLLVVKDEKGLDQPVRSIADWEVRRAHILAHFAEVAGPLPTGERRVPLAMETLSEERLEGYIRKKIRFAVEPGDRVPAWLLLPTSAGNGPRPAMLALHQTIAIGKDEPVGLGTNQELAYARELVQRGYVCLAPDYPNFGEYKVDPYALGYASATMKGVWNHMRAVDLLASLPEVDPGRIGVIGHSLGGHNAIFVALHDSRIRAVVSSCGFCRFPRYDAGNVAGWSHRGYMPRLRTEYNLDLKRIPFDFSELIAALAPRGFFTNSPLHDANFDVTGARECIADATLIYKLFQARDRLAAVHPDAQHSFPQPSREAAYAFLKHVLHDAR